MAFIIPEVFADTINKEIDQNLILGKYMAVDVTNRVPEILKYGDTVHFPTFDRLSAPELMEAPNSLTPERMSSTDSTAKIVHYGKSVEIYDEDMLFVKGDPKGEAAKQLGELFAGRIDLSLTEAIDTGSPLEEAAPVNSLTDIHLQNGLALFRDQRNVVDIAGIVANSALVKSFLNMTNFVQSDYTFAAQGSGIVINNCLGLYQGIPVYLDDMVTFDEANQECKTYIIKRNTLAYVRKREFLPESDRDINKKCDIFAADILYATKLMHSNKAVVLHYTAF